MDSYPQSQLKTSRGFTYNYISLPATTASAPTILFLHGFPSSIFHWRHQVKFFSGKGYGIIAPELLGYGKSSKPLEMEAYNQKGMSNDVKEILDHEKVERVIGVGHDWGSFLLSRLVNFHPEMLSKRVFLDIGYSAPGNGLTRQNVEMINKMVQHHMGYSVFGYFLFFDEKDAAELMDKHVESVESLFHAGDTETIQRYMGAEGGFQTWLENSMTAPKPSYLTVEDQEDFRKQFSKENGGFAPSINWYTSQLHNINATDEKDLPQERHKIQQPTLLISGSNNPITASADFPNQMKPYVSDFDYKSVDAGHWVQLERPEETNEMLNEFFKK